LHPADAAKLAFYGYGLLLLLNNILLMGELKMGQFVKLIFVIFLLEYGFVLAGALLWLGVASFWPPLISSFGDIITMRSKPIPYFIKM
jgi:hypothetical protein